MAEFFLLGILCLADPFAGKPQCAYINEKPIKYYSKDKCEDERVKKMAEMATNLTQKGFVITHLDIQCVLDKTNKNT